MTDATPAAAGAAPSGAAPEPVKQEQEKPAAAPVEKKVAPIPPAAKPEKDLERDHKSKKGMDLPGVSIRRDEDATPHRGADGKFLSRKQHEDVIEGEIFGARERDQDAEKREATGKPGEAAPPPPAPGTEPKTAAPKFKFADEDYKDQAEAEQKVRSLRGMFKPLQERASQAEKDRDYGYEQANGWKRAHDTLAAEVAELRARTGAAPGQAAGSGKAAASPGSRPAGETSTGLPSVDDLLSDVDTDAFEAILAAGGGVSQAGKFLASEILRAVGEKVVPALQAIHEQDLAPMQEAGAYAALEAHADQLVDSLKEYKRHDGTVAYPELQKGETIAQIGQLWRDSGFDPNIPLQSAQGLIAAIAHYREIMGLVTPATSATVPVVPATSAAPAPAASASVPADSGSAIPPHNGRADERLSPGARRLAQALRRSEPMIDSGLGFRRNRASA